MSKINKILTYILIITFIANNSLFAVERKMLSPESWLLNGEAVREVLGAISRGHMPREARLVEEMQDYCQVPLCLWAGAKRRDQGLDEIVSREILHMYHGLTDLEEDAGWNTEWREMREDLIAGLEMFAGEGVLFTIIDKSQRCQESGVVGINRHLLELIKQNENELGTETNVYRQRKLQDNLLALSIYLQTYIYHELRHEAMIVEREVLSDWQYDPEFAAVGIIRDIPVAEMSVEMLRAVLSGVLAGDRRADFQAEVERRQNGVDARFSALLCCRFGGSENNKLYENYLTILEELKIIQPDCAYAEAVALAGYALELPADRAWLPRLEQLQIIQENLAEADAQPLLGLIQALPGVRVLGHLFYNEFIQEDFDSGGIGERRAKNVFRWYKSRRNRDRYVVKKHKLRFRDRISYILYHLGLTAWVRVPEWVEKRGAQKKHDRELAKKYILRLIELLKQYRGETDQTLSRGELIVFRRRSVPLTDEEAVMELLRRWRELDSGNYGNAVLRGSLGFKTSGLINTVCSGDEARFFELVNDACMERALNGDRRFDKINVPKLVSRQRIKEQIIPRMALLSKFQRHLALQLNRQKAAREAFNSLCRKYKEYSGGQAPSFTKNEERGFMSLYRTLHQKLVDSLEIDKTVLKEDDLVEVLLWCCYFAENIVPAYKRLDFRRPFPCNDAELLVLSDLLQLFRQHHISLHKQEFLDPVKTLLQQVVLIYREKLVPAIDYLKIAGKKYGEYRDRFDRKPLDSLKITWGWGFGRWLGNTFRDKFGKEFTGEVRVLEVDSRLSMLHESFKVETGEEAEFPWQVDDHIVDSRGEYFGSNGRRVRGKIHTANLRDITNGRIIREEKEGEGVYELIVSCNDVKREKDLFSWFTGIYRLLRFGGCCVVALPAGNILPESAAQILSKMGFKVVLQKRVLTREQNPNAKTKQFSVIVLQKRGMIDLTLTEDEKDALTFVYEGGTGKRQLTAEPENLDLLPEEELIAAVDGRDGKLSMNEEGEEAARLLAEKLANGLRHSDQLKQQAEKVNEIPELKEYIEELLAAEISPPNILADYVKGDLQKRVEAARAYPDIFNEEVVGGLYDLVAELEELTVFITPKREEEFRVKLAEIKEKENLVPRLGRELRKRYEQVKDFTKTDLNKRNLAEVTAVNEALDKIVREMAAIWQAEERRQRLIVKHGEEFVRLKKLIRKYQTVGNLTAQSDRRSIRQILAAKKQHLTAEMWLLTNRINERLAARLSAGKSVFNGLAEFDEAIARLLEWREIEFLFPYVDTQFLSLAEKQWKRKDSRERNIITAGSVFAKRDRSGLERLLACLLVVDDWLALKSCGVDWSKEMAALVAGRPESEYLDILDEKLLNSRFLKSQSLTAEVLTIKPGMTVSEIKDTLIAASERMAEGEELVVSLAEGRRADDNFTAFLARLGLELKGTYDAKLELLWEQGDLDRAEFEELNRFISRKRRFFVVRKEAEADKPEQYRLVLAEEQVENDDYAYRVNNRKRVLNDLSNEGLQLYCVEIMPPKDPGPKKIALVGGAKRKKKKKATKIKPQVAITYEGIWQGQEEAVRDLAHLLQDFIDEVGDHTQEAIDMRQILKAEGFNAVVSHPVLTELYIESPDEFKQKITELLFYALYIKQLYSTYREFCKAVWSFFPYTSYFPNYLVSLDGKKRILPIINTSALPKTGEVLNWARTETLLGYDRSPFGEYTMEGICDEVAGLLLDQRRLFVIGDEAAVMPFKKGSKAYTQGNTVVSEGKKIREPGDEEVIMAELWLHFLADSPAGGLREIVDVFPDIRATAGHQAFMDSTDQAAKKKSAVSADESDHIFNRSTRIMTCLARINKNKHVEIQYLRDFEGYSRAICMLELPRAERMKMMQMLMDKYLPVLEGKVEGEGYRELKEKVDSVILAVCPGEKIPPRDSVYKRDGTAVGKAKARHFRQLSVAERQELAGGRDLYYHYLYGDGKKRLIARHKRDVFRQESSEDVIMAEELIDLVLLYKNKKLYYLSEDERNAIKVLVEELLLKVGDRDAVQDVQGRVECYLTTRNTVNRYLYFSLLLSRIVIKDKEEEDILAVSKEVADFIGDKEPKVRAQLYDRRGLNLIVLLIEYYRLQQLLAEEADSELLLEAGLRAGHLGREIINRDYGDEIAVVLGLQGIPEHKSLLPEMQREIMPIRRMLERRIGRMVGNNNIDDTQAADEALTICRQLVTLIIYHPDQIEDALRIAARGMYYLNTERAKIFVRVLTEMLKKCSADLPAGYTVDGIRRELDVLSRNVDTESLRGDYTQSEAETAVFRSLMPDNPEHDQLLEQIKNNQSFRYFLLHRLLSREVNNPLLEGRLAQLLSLTVGCIDNPQELALIIGPFDQYINDGDKSSLAYRRITKYIYPALIGRLEDFCRGDQEEALRALLTEGIYRYFFISNLVSAALGQSPLFREYLADLLLAEEKQSFDYVYAYVHNFIIVPRRNSAAWAEGEGVHHLFSYLLGKYSADKIKENHNRFYAVFKLLAEAPVLLPGFTLDEHWPEIFNISGLSSADLKGIRYVFHQTAAEIQAVSKRTRAKDLASSRERLEYQDDDQGHASIVQDNIRRQLGYEDSDGKDVFEREIARREEEEKGEVPFLPADLVFAVGVGAVVAFLVQQIFFPNISLLLVFSTEIIIKLCWLVFAFLSPWFFHEVVGHYLFGKIRNNILQKYEDYPKVDFKFHWLWTEVKARGKISAAAELQLTELRKTVARLGPRLNSFTASGALAILTVLVFYGIHSPFSIITLSYIIAANAAALISWLPLTDSALTSWRFWLNKGRRQSDGGIIRGLKAPQKRPLALEIQDEIIRVLRKEREKHPLPKIGEEELFRAVQRRLLLRHLFFWGKGKRKLFKKVLQQLKRAEKVIKLHYPEDVYVLVRDKERDLIAEGLILPLNIDINGKTRQGITCYFSAALKEELIKKEEIIEIISCSPLRKRRDGDVLNRIIKVYLSKENYARRTNIEHLTVKTAEEEKDSTKTFHVYDKLMQVLGFKRSKANFKRVLEWCVQNERLPEFYDILNAMVICDRLPRQLIKGKKTHRARRLLLWSLLPRDLQPQGLPEEVARRVKRLRVLKEMRLDVSNADKYHDYYQFFSELMEPDEPEADQVLAILVFCYRLAQTLNPTIEVPAGADDEGYYLYEEIVRIFRPLFKQHFGVELSSKLIDSLYESVYPKRYKMAAKSRNVQLKRLKEDLAGQLGCAQTTTALAESLKQLILAELPNRIKNKIEIVITGREKGVWSSDDKLKRSVAANHPNIKRIEDIHDLLAFRVIIADREDAQYPLTERKKSDLCEEIANIVADNRLFFFLADPLKSKNYIKNPKPNGYQSLHAVYALADGGQEFEVQIRTAMMHEVAETGSASYAAYQADKGPTITAEEEFAGLRLKDASKQTVYDNSGVKVGQYWPQAKVELSVDQELAEEIAACWGDLLVILAEAYTAIPAAGRGGLNNMLAIGLVAESPTLFVDCRRNGFVGINRQFLEIIRRDKSPGKLVARILLIVGLHHELAHECGCKDEEWLTEEGLSLFKRLAGGNQAVLIAAIELLAGVVTEDSEFLLALKREAFGYMLSSKDNLQLYIDNGWIAVLVPEWRDWVALFDNEAFRQKHHVSPQDHILLIFTRLEEEYFDKIIAKKIVTEEDRQRLCRVLFLHDFGKILALQEDPEYGALAYVEHPEKSAEIAGPILQRLGSSQEEIAADLVLIKYHSVLADLARYGETEISLVEFINDLTDVRDLELLEVVQLVDAASVRHMFANSLSEGLEKRVEEIVALIKPILWKSGPRRAEAEHKLVSYLDEIERQNWEIEKGWNQLKQAINKHDVKIDEKILFEAFQAMHRSHLGVIRKDGETPYTLHCIETTRILIEELKVTDPQWIIASLLHDVPEDSRTNIGAIREAFGREVADIVYILQKPLVDYFASVAQRDKAYIEKVIFGTDTINDRQILAAAQTIKIADRMHNLRTLDIGDDSFVKRKVKETLTILTEYFIKETELPSTVLNVIIDELILTARHWRALTEEEIRSLQSLAPKGGQIGFFSYVLSEITRNNPRVVAFYNKHHPLEPLEDVVSELQRHYLPGEILFVEFPVNYRPLGYALNSYDYLLETAKAMAAGTFTLNGNSAETNRQFGRALLRLIELFRKEKDDICRLHEEGIKEGSGKARDYVKAHLHRIRTEFFAASEIDYVTFRDMLQMLASQNPAFRNEEELFVSRLAEKCPDLHFISLHGAFVDLNRRRDDKRPYNDIHGTERAYHYHRSLTEKIRARTRSGRFPKWDFMLAPFLSELLSEQVDFDQFSNEVSYTYMELPLFPHPQDSQPIDGEQLLQAVIGSYFLKDPYFAAMTARAHRNLDMDYFRKTPLAEQARDELAADLREYLDLFLQQIKPENQPLFETAFRHFHPASDVLAYLNHLYYRLKGGDAFKNRDFPTLVAWNSLTARTNAEEFYEHLISLERAGKLPAEIVILELGIGNGRYAADFLDRLKELDKGTRRGFYRRIRYILGDFSIRMLKDAKQQPYLLPHAQVTDFRVLDATDLSVLETGNTLLVRFNELYDDLSGSELLYKKGNKFYRLKLKLKLTRNFRAVKKIDGQAVSRKDFISLYWQGGLKKLADLDPSFLAYLEWEKEYEEIDLTDIPFNKFIRRWCEGAGNGLFPVNVGALGSLYQALALLHPEGYLQMFDYGFTDNRYLAERPDADKIEHVAGQPTVDVNFPFLRHAAEGLMFHVTLEAQAEYLSRRIGTRVIGRELLHLATLCPQALPRLDDLMDVKGIRMMLQRKADWTLLELAQLVGMEDVIYLGELETDRATLDGGAEALLEKIIQAKVRRRLKELTQRFESIWVTRQDLLTDPILGALGIKHEAIENMVEQIFSVAPHLLRSYYHFNVRPEEDYKAVIPEMRSLFAERYRDKQANSALYENIIAPIVEEYGLLLGLPLLSYFSFISDKELAKTKLRISRRKNNKSHLFGFSTVPIFCGLAMLCGSFTPAFIFIHLTAVSLFCAIPFIFSHPDWDSRFGAVMVSLLRVLGFSLIFNAASWSFPIIIIFTPFLAHFLWNFFAPAALKADIDSHEDDRGVFWEYVDSGQEADVYRAKPAMVTGLDAEPIPIDPALEVAKRVSSKGLAGYPLFLKHLVLRILDEYFISQGKYRVNHIPQPLGFFNDGYYYAFAPGEENFPWEMLGDDFNTQMVDVKEFYAFCGAFAGYGLEVGQDVADVDEGRISKNIIHADDRGVFKTYELSPDWKRIDVGGMSLGFNLKKFTEKTAEMEEELKEQLGWRYELMVLAAKQIACLERYNLNDAEQRKLDVLVARYFAEYIKSPTEDEVIKRVFRQVREIGTLGRIRAMDVYEFAERMGASEITTTKDTEPVLVVNERVWRSIVILREIDARGLEDLCELSAYLRKSLGGLPEEEFGLTLLRLSMNQELNTLASCPEINGPGIYYNRKKIEKHQDQGVRLTKALIVHELLELSVEEAGLAEDFLVSVMRDNHTIVIEGELRFAHLMGKAETGFSNLILGLKIKQLLVSLAAGALNKEEKRRLKDVIVRLMQLQDKVLRDPAEFTAGARLFWPPDNLPRMFTLTEEPLAEEALRAV